jgi:alpha-ketoglutarate-dependent taurine dioxygenase
MTSSSVPIGIDRATGRPPILRAGGVVDAERWADDHSDELRALVLERGMLMVRGLGLRDATQAEAVFRRLGSLVDETEAFAPRKRYAQGVYSASKWPHNQPMCMHHELSYVQQPPSLLMFACLVAAPTGGATPVADASLVLRSLPPGLVRRFEREGWLLVRSYNEDIGASLAGVFGTDERSVIGRYCDAHEIEYEWTEEGMLRTRQRRAAIVKHPVDGRRCWFNQVGFLSEWTMAPDLREYLLDVYGEEGLPFATCFGNGDPVDAAVVQAIDEAYKAHTVVEPWQSGDLLLVDNIRTAHSREPYEGSREIVVAMADAVRVGP